MLLWDDGCELSIKPYSNIWNNIQIGKQMLYEIITNQSKE